MQQSRLIGWNYSKSPQNQLFPKTQPHNPQAPLQTRASRYFTSIIIQPPTTQHGFETTWRWPRNDSQLTPKYLPDDSQVIPRWLPSDSQMIPRKRSNNSQIIPRWLPENCCMAWGWFGVELRIASGWLLDSFGTDLGWLWATFYRFRPHEGSVFALISEHEATNERLLSGGQPKALPAQSWHRVRSQLI